MKKIIVVPSHVSAEVLMGFQSCTPDSRCKGKLETKGVPLIANATHPVRSVVHSTNYMYMQYH